MAYSDFSLREATQKFHLVLAEAPDLFAAVPEVEPSPFLRTLLQEFLPLALAIDTEKARSELVIAPLLADLRAQLGHRVSVFSGIDFTVDPKLGLAGYCDFILSRSPEQQFLSRPAAPIVEAKNENLKSSFGQCIAEMVGARVFNELEGETVPVISGAVTSGSLWRFLQLEGESVTIDQQEYHIRQLAKVIGIIVRCWSAEAGTGSTGAVDR